MKRLLIIITFIFIMTTIFWEALALVSWHRSDVTNTNIGNEVALMWGGAHTTRPPTVTGKYTKNVSRRMTQKEKIDEIYWLRKGNPDLPKDFALPEADQWLIEGEEVEISPEITSSRIQVDVRAEHRKKGLNWFPTYEFDFSGKYTVKNTHIAATAVSVQIPFSSEYANFDNLMVTVEGEQGDFTYGIDGRKLQSSMTMQAGEERSFIVSYSSRGMSDWNYAFNSTNQMLRDFEIIINTNFDDFDLPTGSMSPNSKVPHGDKAGWELAWKMGNMVTQRNIGVTVPDLINPGMVASQMSKNAPISLLFFFFSLLMLQFTRGYKLHYVHYWFTAVSMFSFDLLFANLAGKINIYLAFGIAATVSMVLVVGYLQKLLGGGRAKYEVAGLQLFYQVMFGLACLLRGDTGLTITVVAIATLGMAMRSTVDIDWDKTLARKE